jgi:hypothetical protein
MYVHTCVLLRAKLASGLLGFLLNGEALKDWFIGLRGELGKYIPVFSV